MRVPVHAPHAPDAPAFRPVAFAAVLAAAVAAAALAPLAAVAHEERSSSFPDGTGSVPVHRPYNPAAANLVACKPGSASAIAAMPAGPDRALNEALLPHCAFEHLQAAVDAVAVAGTNIYVLPGTYYEEPSLAPPSPECASVPENGVITYAQNVACPHQQNLVAIMGDDGRYPAPCVPLGATAPAPYRLCHLQIEGTGLDPMDVLFDAQRLKLNGIRGDRADGLYIRNLAVQRTDFNGLYVLETDGFVLDRVVGRSNYEYGVLTFAVDHGVIKDCETYYNGDSGVYPGSASDLHGIVPHAAVEIYGCDSHHNVLGYSGTAGNSVHAHHNRFHHNAAGAAMDSFFPGHPGLPQDSAVFEHNWIFSNNENYYDNYYGYDGKEEICKQKLYERDLEDGVVCPVVPVPVGTGILVAGGNANLFEDNWVWDNWRYGMMLFTVPAPLREEYDPALVLDTSHDNQFISNKMSVDPRTSAADWNGLDFWWDEGGRGNCWQDNSAPGMLGVLSDPAVLPSCNSPTKDVQRPPSPKLATLVPCALFDGQDNPKPVGCEWMTTPPEPTQRVGGDGLPALP